MKKFLKLFFAAALLGGLAGMAVSCKDYEEQINSLEKKVSDLESKISSLQSKIDGGAVITSVTSTSDGWHVALSDGSAFDVKNGANGKDGKDGKDGTNGTSSVVSIGANGNWFIDGADTGVAAKGEDGKNGKDGTTPTIEIKDGYWYINGENTGVKAEGSSSSSENPTYALYNTEDGTLTFKNVPDENGETNDYVVYLTNELRSLVLIPPMYVDGIETIQIDAFMYYPLALGGDDDVKIDSNTERWAVQVDEDGIIAMAGPIIPDVYVKYHVNPASAIVTEDDALEFVIQNEVPSRSNNLEDDIWDIEPEFVSCEDGILTVKVNLVSFDLSQIFGPDYDRINSADLNQWMNEIYSVVDIAALKVIKDNEEETTVVSDYARVEYNSIWGATIAEPGLVAIKHHPDWTVGVDDPDYIDAHYRSLWMPSEAGYGKFGYDEQAYLDDQLLWTAGMGDPTMEETHATCDTVVLYNGSIDLKTIVEPHATYDAYWMYYYGWWRMKHPMYYPGYGIIDYYESCPVETEGWGALDMELLGLSWKFEPVKNYKIGTPQTDQINFFNLTEDGILTPKVYGTEGKAAIGRTPIVRVKLMRGEDVVWVSYIKLQIVDQIIQDVDFGVTLDVYTKAVDGVIKGFNPDCNGVTRVTSVEDMNVKVYNYVGYSKDDFHALFTGSDSWTDYLGNPSDVRDTVVHCPDNTDPAFPYFEAIDCCGEVIENPPASVTGTEATHVLAWKVWAEDIWDAMYSYQVLKDNDMLPKNVSTDSLYHYVYYLNPTTGKTVVIRLAAAFDDFNTNIPTANFVPGYWKEEATAPNGVATEFNVAVPDATYPLNMDTLKSNLHSSFVKYPGTHATAANQTFVDAGITDVNFYFDAVQIAKINKIGKYYATFYTNRTANQVKADPDLNMDCLELYLGKFGPDKDHATTVNVKIAEIYNETPEAPAPRWSQVWYGGNDPEDSGLEFGFGGEDGPSYADSLLNTGVMYTYFGAWGEVCDDAAKTLFISFGDAKASYFRGNFIRPINATTNSPVPFVDHATWNYPGSYINVKDLVDLSDWRGHKFSSEEGLWTYYGIDTIIVETDGAKTDGGFNTAGTLSGDIKLVQYAAADFTAKYWDAKDKVYKDYAADKAPYGYLTYRNLGTDLKAEYHIWVPVKINYDWGWYLTEGEEMIKITVKPAE